MYAYNYLNNLRGFIDKTEIDKTHDYINDEKNISFLNLDYIYYNLSQETVNKYFDEKNIIDKIKNNYDLVYFSGISMFENVQLNYNYDINSIFDGCLKLRHIILKNMFKNNSHTLNIQINNMFKNFLHLELIDLSGMFMNNKGTKIISCKEMFENCQKLKYINFNNMFNGVEFVEDIDFSQMFSGCESLYYLNFNNFLLNCPNLKTFNISNIFKNCFNLKCVFLLNSSDIEVESYKYMSFDKIISISLDIDEYGNDCYENLKKNSFSDSIIRSLKPGSTLYVSSKREFEYNLNLEYINDGIEIITIKDNYLYKKYKLTQTTTDTGEILYNYIIIENLETKKITFLESILN